MEDESEEHKCTMPVKTRELKIKIIISWKILIIFLSDRTEYAVQSIADTEKVGFNWVMDKK